tara:strand:+ start:435 stop:578 length:144 start_codon:yes stop_codon:yes gene_type:complete
MKKHKKHIALLIVFILGWYGMYRLVRVEYAEAVNEAYNIPIEEQLKF